MFPIKFDCVSLLAVLLFAESRYFAVECTIITSVGNIFEAFSPYAIVQFFEFSDKGWNISENCLRHMFSYVEGLRRGALWAVKLYDATSYYGGAALGGSTIRVQNSQICRGLLHENRAQKAQPELLEVSSINSTVPFPVQVIVGHYVLEFAGRKELKEKFQKIQQLICFPQSCNDQDLEQILAVQLFQSSEIVLNNSYVRHRIVYGNYSPLQDRNFYILIGFLSMALFVYTLAFVLHIYFSFKSSLDFDAESGGDIPRRSPLTANIENLFAKKFQIKIIDTNWSLKMQTENLPRIVTTLRKRRFEDFLSQISIQNTIYDLFQSEEDLPQLRLQFIFTVLLIYAHLAVESTFLANNASLSGDKRENVVVRHSNYLFNGLLVLSASKLSFSYLQGSPRNKLNVLSNLGYIVKLVGFKILRHAPSYIFCLFTAQMLDRYFHTNIAVEIPSFDFENCGFKNIFSTIFYWDIFFPLTERCMPWAWIMSLEVQLFMVACLVLLLTEIQAQYASVIGAGFFVVSILGATLWDFGASGGNNLISNSTELLHFNLISENIFLSIPPYLVGLYLGYILHRSATNIKLNFIVLLLGYTGCIFIWIFFQFGFKMISANVPKLVAVIVNVLGHIMWSLALMWIVLTLFSMHGVFLGKWLCLKSAAALETLSPICLLVAPILIRFFVFTTDAPIYTSSLRIFPQAVGCVLTTYVISFFLYVIFDGLFYTIFKASIQ